MIRVGHFSDLHYSAKNLDEADRCFGFAVDEAIRRGIDVAVLSGDATDHALEMHNPAVESLERQVARLADHCPVLMLQGTFSHEPPGTLATFSMLRGRYPVRVVQRICQLALLEDGSWAESAGWRFDTVPAARALFTCVPTVNKANVAAAVGAADAAIAHGEELAALLAGYGSINEAARQSQVATIGVSHGTVAGCVTEHGVPMAGFDHEFTSGSLFSAGAQAFMLGHIHRHQSWEDGGRLVAYAGSIGRFHHGEIGDKGFLLWHVGAALARCELVATPARRTLDLVFEGAPDLAQIEAALHAQDVTGAHVRVRWTVADEDRHQVDREAIRRALKGAMDIQLEGRVVPIVRSRAAGISRCSSLADKVRAWCVVAGVNSEPLLECLTELACQEPSAIAGDLLSTVPTEQAVKAHAPARADGASQPAVAQVDAGVALELF
jgi:exonuclease SbcD